MKRYVIFKNILLLILIVSTVSLLMEPEFLPGTVGIVISAAALIVLWIGEWRGVYVPLIETEKILNREESSEKLIETLEENKDHGRVRNMIERVARQSMDLQGEQLYAKQIELAALQSQINPHFLYNSLDTIRGQAIVDGNRDVAMMIKTLSAFFRYSISRTAVGVTLRDELDNIRNYMNIQRYRFGDRFRLEIEVDPQEAYDFYVPRLILQPIVENAVLHGLPDRIEGGEITISVDVTDDLSIVVADNGKGMSLEELDALNQKIHTPELSEKAEDKNTGHTGIALVNIQRQLEVRYGKPYGIRIYSSKGRGTEVEIVLPVQRNKEGSDIE